jgi:hypothetical protein
VTTAGLPRRVVANYPQGYGLAPPRRGTVRVPMWDLLAILGANREAAYSADEVRRRLIDSDVADPRTCAVQAAARETARWTARLTSREVSGLGQRTADRLPTIVAQYMQGRHLNQIGAEVALFAPATRADSAITIASRCIAAHLNACRCQAARWGCACRCP